jgi:polyhydroxyalkanoate synthase
VPLLFVPPTINKYYILDISPGRSMVEWLLGEQQQVFTISWRNPDAAQGHFDLDT